MKASIRQAMLAAALAAAPDHLVKISGKEYVRVTAIVVSKRGITFRTRLGDMHMPLDEQIGGQDSCLKLLGDMAAVIDLNALVEVVST